MNTAAKRATRTAEQVAADEIAWRLDQIEELVGILSQDDLTQEERREYLECVENAHARLEEARAKLLKLAA